MRVLYKKRNCLPVRGVGVRHEEEGDSPLYTLSPFQRSTVNSASAVRATSPVGDGTPFGNMTGILKPSPFDPRTPAAIIGEMKWHFFLNVSHRAEILTESGPLMTIEPVVFRSLNG